MKTLRLAALWVAVMGLSGLSDLSMGQTDSHSEYGAFPSFLKAQKVAVLNAQVDGVIKTIIARSGDFVKKDDVLVKLDDELINLQVERIQTQIDLDVSKEEARINLEYATDTFDIVQKIFEKKSGGFSFASVKEFKEAKQRKEVAELGADKAKLAMLVLENELKMNQLTLRKHSIKAPMDAVVVPFSSIPSLEGRIIKQLEEGETVRAGQELVALMKVDRLRVEHSLPAVELPNIKPGQKAHIFVRGDSAGPYLAEVVYISPTLTVGEFTVGVEFDNPPVDKPVAGRYRYRFREGMRARVEFDIEQN